MTDLSFDVTLPRTPSGHTGADPKPSSAGEPFTWHVVNPVEKLVLRGRLPGAYGFDRIAAALTEAQRRGVPFGARLAPALPSSWMVNSRAASPVFQVWLSSVAEERIEALCRLLEGGPARFTALSPQERADVDALFSDLASLAQPSGALWPGLACALSKVLALLVPETVPLLDDAAVHVLTGAGTEPRDALHPSAPPACILPCLDAFLGAVALHEEVLSSIAEAFAREDVGTGLLPAQVLDRLLWVDSWGYKDLGLRRVSGRASVRVEVTQR